MNVKKSILAIMVVTALSLSSCYYHNWENIHPGGQIASKPCVLADTISYNADVVPILNASCGVSGSQALNCHGAGATGPDLSTYTNFSSFTSPDSLNSVYSDITWSGNKMPKNGSKLSQCDINKIIRWMDQGSKNN